MEEEKEVLKEEATEKELPTGTDQPESKGSDEETITIPKTELEKLKSDRDNYRDGLLSYKEKESKEPVKEVKKETPKEKGEYLTKQEFQKAVEKEAISKICSDNPEINDNWSDIMGHYSNRHGNMTTKDIQANIKDAYTLWKAYNPDTDKKEDKQAKADIATEATKEGGAEKADAKVKTEGRKILKGKTSPTDWYKK